MKPEELKAIRIKAKLSQKELAKLLQLSSQTRISEYETGRRKPGKQIILLYRLLERGIKIKA